MQPATRDRDTHAVAGARYVHVGEVDLRDFALVGKVVDSVGVRCPALRKRDAGAGAVGSATKPDRVSGHRRAGRLLHSAPGLAWVPGFESLPVGDT